jgi:hypothetical protein
VVRNAAGKQRRRRNGQTLYVGASAGVWSWAREGAGSWCKESERWSTHGNALDVVVGVKHRRTRGKALKVVAGG